jgi:LuxR family transcriptional regulator, maltose regulon positive regulatory protein
MSKVTVPELPGWVVARPHIEKLLAEGARGPLTSVTGPPGAGKTMAVASWAASSYPCTLVWITLDDYDNRPRVFWSYVVAALHGAGLAVPRVMPGPTRDAVDYVFLVRLASVLAAQDRPVVMVLDDLHLLTEPATLDGLTYVLRNAGPGLHLVMASRMDPLVPLHRYRLAGELTEIRADDLAFSVEESGLLLAHHGVTVSSAALESLTGRTEGWAAGIRLAALSLQGHPDPDQFVKELDAEDSAITGYLVDEVLGAQPASVRDMLLRTSILDCVCADLASELTDDEHGADALPALARANAFVRPVGQGWYRYHSLLAAVLRLKLRIECRGSLPDLYGRAARWYQRNGRLDEAVRYAAESGDWRFAAEIVVDEFAVGRLLEPRGNHPLAETFRRMPRDPAWTQPEPLLVLAATGLSEPVIEASITALAAAESALERLPGDDQTPARLAAALVRLALSRRVGDLGVATAAIGQAEALVGRLPEEVHARHTELRAQILRGRGVVELWAGRLEAAAAAFQAGAAASTSETSYERADCLGYLALVEALSGRLSCAIDHADEAAETTGGGGSDLAEYITPAASVALASVYLQRSDTHEAHAQLKLAEAALRLRPDKLVSTVAGMVAAQRRLAQGRAAAASEMIRRARQQWSPSPPDWLELRLTVLESRACLTAGHFPEAVLAPEGQPQEGQTVPLVIERLSEREREVLIHLSGMLSTAEIATEMYLSVNTVKTHLRSIYRKLSVAHRSEAVRRARQLGLI